MQIIELDILKFIDSVCKKNGLRYFLCGGTLLGAVRHKGFIPWDNDIDISMPRKDYDKFVDICNKEAENMKLPYEILKLRNDVRYCCPFAKVTDKRTILIDGKEQKFKGDPMGVFVDIFPIDGMETNTSQDIDNVLKIRDKCIWLGLSFAHFGNLSIKETVKLLYYKIFYAFRNKEKCLNQMENVLRKNEFDSSPFIITTFGLRGEKEVVEQQKFAESILFQFEDGMFPAPKGYDIYLTQMYGDYMQLPPLEQRAVPHNFEGYWL